MGTLSRSVNFFKGFFQRIKQKLTRQRPKDDFRPQFTLHTMMTRKYRGPCRDHVRQYHGQRQKQHHFVGGGRVCAAHSDSTIFFPKNRRHKAYYRENLASTFNKNR